MAKMCFSIMFALLVAIHMGSNSVKASPYPDDGDILFDFSDSEEYEMPPACEGKSFCFEKGDNYPEERIAELLTDMRDLNVDYSEAQTIIRDRKKRESVRKEVLLDATFMAKLRYLGGLHITDNVAKQSTASDTMAFRAKEQRPTYDEPDCPSNSTENPIYYIVDDNDKVRVVVQSPEKFLQIYSVKWCLVWGSTNSILNMIPSRLDCVYVGRCCAITHGLSQQNEGRITSETPHFNKHIYMRYAIECVTTTMSLDFFVLSDEVDLNTNKPKMAIAKPKGGIPVCCKCQYSSNE